MWSMGLGRQRAPLPGGGLAWGLWELLIYFISLLLFLKSPPPFCVCRSVESTCSKGED